MNQSTQEQVGLNLDEEARKTLGEVYQILLDLAQESEGDQEDSRPGDAEARKELADQ